MATPIVLEPKEQSQVVVQGNASKTPIVIGGNQQSGGTGGGSGILEEFWDVVPDDSEEIISEEDIHAAVEDIWNTTFNS